MPQSSKKTFFCPTKERYHLVTDIKQSNLGKKNEVFLARFTCARSNESLNFPGLTSGGFFSECALRPKSPVPSFSQKREASFPGFRLAFAVVSLARMTLRALFGTRSTTRTHVRGSAKVSLVGKSILPWQSFRSIEDQPARFSLNVRIIQAGAADFVTHSLHERDHHTIA